MSSQRVIILSTFPAADANAYALFTIDGLALVEYNSDNIQFVVRAFAYFIHGSV